MRIISGRLKGRSFDAPTGTDTRPTTDALRESIFDALLHHFDVHDARILDLCCGSGALAFEALSRGAATATLVDHDATVCRLVRRNADALGLSDMVTIAKADAVGIIPTFGPAQFDLVLADPPYPARICNKIVAALSAADVVARDGILILEHDDAEAVLPHPTWHPITSLTRGRTVVEMLRRVAASS